jgi:hypothetical protein
MLNRGCAWSSLQTVARIWSRWAAIFSIDPDLDEFVGLESVVDFFEHGRRKTIAGHAHHGVQMVGLRTKRSPLCGREINHFPTH